MELGFLDDHFWTQKCIFCQFFWLQHGGHTPMGLWFTDSPCCTTHISLLKIQYTEGVFWGENWPNWCLKKSGKLFFSKKIKTSIQSGIHKGPMQAFTALCRTKIVAATAILWQVFFLEIFFRFPPRKQSYTKKIPKKPIAPFHYDPNPTFKAVKTMYTFLALFLQKIYHPLPE